MAVIYSFHNHQIVLLTFNGKELKGLKKQMGETTNTYITQEGNSDTEGLNAIIKVWASSLFAREKPALLDALLSA